MNATKIAKEARRLCTHTIVFTDHTEKLAVVRAMQGRTTLAIAEELGLTLSQAQYRILKAQRSLKTHFRSDYRNGESKLTQKMMCASAAIALGVVENKIAPKFIPFARPNVPRTP
jgi:hypothetical protein